MKMKMNQRGFSLIERLIVVPIIGIFSFNDTATPQIYTLSLHDALPISSLRTMTGAEATYQSTKGAGEYGSLTDLQTEGLIDSVLGAGTKSGYAYTVAPLVSSATAPARFNASCIPQSSSGIGATGTRSFYTNESGVIYFVAGGTAPTGAATTRVVSGGA